MCLCRDGVYSDLAMGSAGRLFPLLSGLSSRCQNPPAVSVCVGNHVGVVPTPCVNIVTANACGRREARKRRPLVLAP